MIANFEKVTDIQKKIGLLSFKRKKSLRYINGGSNLDYNKVINQSPISVNMRFAVQIDS